MKMKNSHIIKLASLVMAIAIIGTGCTQTGQEAGLQAAVISTTETDDTNKDDTDTDTEVMADYQTFFEEGVVHAIDVTITEDDWADILANPEDETYHEAKVTIDGVVADTVGLRTKGNSSLKSVASSESDRFSFKIKLDEYVEDQTLLGLDEFVLNNMFSDASYMREYLSYKIMGEAGLAVPLSSFVEVSINGERFGLYLMVEAIEDSYLNRAFGENEGNLYKQEQGSTLIYETDEAYKSSEQKNGDDETKTDLANFIKILNEMPDGEKGEIESVLNVDSALKYIAANTVLENYDSYNGSFAQNYYLYNQSGQFNVIPWDFNMAFGGFQGGALSTIDIDTPISGTSLEKVPLIQNLLEVEAYKTRYYEIIEDYLTILEDFEAEVSALKSLIRPSVEADPTKFATIEQFDLVTTYQEDGPVEANAEGGFMGMDKGMGISENSDSDASTSATENVALPSGERPMPNGEMPKGEIPKGEIPSGMRPEGAPPENGPGNGGMRGGMSLEGSSTSLINIMRARIANLQEQLAN
jgi:spore coat protein CotH